MNDSARLANVHTFEDSGSLNSRAPRKVNLEPLGLGPVERSGKGVDVAELADDAPIAAFVASARLVAATQRLDQLEKRNALDCRRV